VPTRHKHDQNVLNRKVDERHSAVHLVLEYQKINYSEVSGVAFIPESCSAV